MNTIKCVCVLWHMYVCTHIPKKVYIERYTYVCPKDINTDI